MKLEDKYLIVLCAVVLTSLFIIFLFRKDVPAPLCVGDGEYAYIVSAKYDSGVCDVDIMNCYEVEKTFRIFSESRTISIHSAGISFIDSTIKAKSKESMVVDCNQLDTDNHNWILLMNWDNFVSAIVWYPWSDPDMSFGNLNINNVDWKWTCRGPSWNTVIENCPEDQHEIVIK